jgi:hypothetical protein
MLLTYQRLENLMGILNPTHLPAWILGGKRLNMTCAFGSVVETRATMAETSAARRMRREASKTLFLP